MAKEEGGGVEQAHEQQEQGKQLLSITQHGPASVFFFLSFLPILLANQHWSMIKTATAA